MERKIIGLIAQAHGGRARSGNKDTIVELINSESPNIGSITIYARRLAAILRFADELSENPRRADEIVLRSDTTASPESVVHNLYCKLINVRVDYVGRAIGIDFDIEKSLLDRMFILKEEDQSQPIYFVDYIIKRLEKCEQERRYCNRFLSGFAGYDRIRVKLEIFEGDKTIEEIAFDLEDSGYPSVTPSIREIAPRLDGASLRAKHFHSGVT